MQRLRIYQSCRSRSVIEELRNISVCEVKRRHFRNSPPCRSIITFKPALFAQSSASPNFSYAPCTNGSPSIGMTLQYPIGMRTWFSPAAAIWRKSSWLKNESQWPCSFDFAASFPSSSVNVHSSFAPLPSKRDGVIHGSSTNQPPVLTPRTF
jgi:hypothetical protein